MADEEVKKFEYKRKPPQKVGAARLTKSYNHAGRHKKKYTGTMQEITNK